MQTDPVPEAGDVRLPPPPLGQGLLAQWTMSWEQVGRKWFAWLGISIAALFAAPIISVLALPVVSNPTWCLPRALELGVAGAVGLVPAAVLLAVARSQLTQTAREVMVLSDHAVVTPLLGRKRVLPLAQVTLAPKRPGEDLAHQPPRLRGPRLVIPAFGAETAELRRTLQELGVHMEGGQ